MVITSTLHLGLGMGLLRGDGVSAAASSCVLGMFLQMDPSPSLFLAGLCCQKQLWI